MNPSRIAASLALVLLAAGARAQSSIPEDAVPLVSDLLIVEQAGVSSGEPAIDATASERADEKAAIEELNRERELESVWAPLP